MFLGIFRSFSGYGFFIKYEVIIWNKFFICDGTFGTIYYDSIFMKPVFIGI